MSDNLTAVLIVAMSVMGPVWLILRYKSKAALGGRLSAGDAARLEQAMRAARAMEHRVVALERILDAEAPAWRGAEAGGLHGRQVG